MFSLFSGGEIGQPLENFPSFLCSCVRRTDEPESHTCSEPVSLAFISQRWLCVFVKSVADGGDPSHTKTPQIEVCFEVNGF